MHSLCRLSKLSLKVGEGGIGWHIQALFTRRSPVQLKHVLCKIDADDGNFFHGCPILQLVFSTSQAWHIAMPLGRAASTPSLGCNTLIYNDAVFLNPFSSDLRGKHRTKSVTPEPHRFVADIDATFMQQILDIAKGKWKPDIHHHRQADDLWAGFEIPKRGAFCHPVTLVGRLASLKLVSSDTARPNAWP